MGGTETVHEHHVVNGGRKEHCCDTQGELKVCSGTPLSRTSLLRQLMCPYQGVLILGVGLYIGVLVREVPLFLLRGVPLLGVSL